MPVQTLGAGGVEVAVGHQGAPDGQAQLAAVGVAGEDRVVPVPAECVQHAQVRVEDQTIDDQRPFVDWFVKHDGEWRLRLAVDLPAASGQAPDAGA